jgi:hypothetical protein
MVGDSDNLKRLTEIDTPMKYLNLFNDLNWLYNSYGYEVDNSNIITRAGYPFNQFRSEGMTL